MLLLSIALLLFPFAFLDKGFGRRAKFMIISFFCSLCVFLGGIRWNTGTDWNPYYYNFLNSVTYDRAINSPISFEWGFSVLNFLVNKLTGSFTAFLFIFIFITVYLKFKVLVSRQFISYGLLSLFIYYCYTIGDISAWRQALAISIIFYSVFFIIERKIFPFVLCVFLASLFHRSAIICLLMYYLYALNLSKKNMLVLFFAGMGLGVSLFNIKVSGLNIPLLADLELFSAYQEKIDAYNEIGQVSYGQVESSLSNFMGYLRKAVFIIPMILLVKKENEVIFRLLNIAIFGSVIYFVFGAISTDFKRLAAYFDILDVILLPAILYGIKDKATRYVFILIFCILVFLRLYVSIYNFWDIYDPFLTIFDFNNNRNMF